MTNLSSEAISDQFDAKHVSGSDQWQRIQLIVKMRWLLLLMITIYGLFSATFVYYTAPDQHLSTIQIKSLIGTFCAIILFNFLSQQTNARTHHAPYLRGTQICADLVFATILIHLTGGGSSWLWPLYLIIALESSFLFTLRRYMAITVGLSSLLFGSVLWAGYHDFLTAIDLNVFYSQHKHNGSYLILLWLWVSILNITATSIGYYLNKTIRQESQEVFNKENRLLRFMESAQDLIIAFDESNKIHFMNNAVRVRLGIEDSEELLSVEQVIHSDDLALWSRKTCLLGVGDTFKPAIFHLRTNSGETVHVDCRISSDTKGRDPLHWAICRDLSKQIESEQQLHHIANHDRLTELTNRHGFTEQAKHLTLMARRAHQQIALAIISVDHLKVINETLSTESGDTLLRTFSQRLLNSVRETDIVGRLAGNQFVILLINIDGRDAVDQVITKLRKRMATPLTIDNHEIFITASIGLSLYPQDATTVEEMINKSSNAMYSVKTHGGNNVTFYNDEMNNDIKNRLLMINGLHQALNKKELKLHYQPKVKIKTGRFNSVEVLLRWSHPTLGQVAPGDFIPMAEESGVIGDLTEWVLYEACTQSQKWQQQGLPPIRVAVNVSGHQLQNRELVGQLKKVLESTGLDPELLEIEVTESVLMQNPDAASSILKEIRKLGIHLSIDDFGTGYSSLAYLKRFPVHSLKIDRSFILDVEQSEKYAAITASIIQMGKTLNLNIIGEGVETLGQMAFLKEHQCDEVQGYLYSMPVPADEIVTLLNNLKDQRNPVSNQIDSENEA
ncbi:MAG: hypothetical protein B6I37_06645 [Desulfobacteraceae bacterium 4572_35.2]|nr:MAG: hypothetical protein B6I37_06645 [Desulfobacteraceae bacterium 4572_35.2]